MSVSLPHPLALFFYGTFHYFSLYPLITKGKRISCRGDFGFPGLPRYVCRESHAHTREVLREYV